MLSEVNSPKIRYFLGDVRDFQRLKQATAGVDIIVHAAAIKQIAAAEYNPMEAIKTNIFGAENIINVAIENNVSKVIALSTDKAANPANLYGATKLCSDKLMVAGNILAGKRSVRFAVVRYGNVLGSRGSVIPFFKEQIKNGYLPITDINMTRFWLTIDEGVQFVLDSLSRMHGGEIFVPKIPLYRITDIATAIGPNCEQKIIGIRPGEKIHEEMITSSDSFFTYDLGKYFAIIPQTPKWSISDFVKEFNAKKVVEGFTYNSGSNSEWVSIQELRLLIQEHVDKTFSI